MPDAIKKPMGKAATQKRLLISEEDIRRRAYELYDQRGREDGHDIADWLTAETELKKAA
jgi:hypothetical protein